MATIKNIRGTDLSSARGKNRKRKKKKKGVGSM